MKKLILLPLIVVAAIGQQSASKIERCGLGSKHDCHCLERTDAIHTKIITSCEAEAKTAKDRDECLHREMIPHCDMAERFTKWDTDGSAISREDGEYDMHSSMGPMCTMACRKHRCECADGPKCDFGMSKEESAQADREERQGR
jgi:hypothetical protein